MWFHLGRALFHTRRNEEALAALRKVTRPRLRDWVYRVAASARLDPERAGEKIEGLRVASPSFDADADVASSTFQDESDRQALRDALRSVGL